MNPQKSFPEPRVPDGLRGHIIVRQASAADVPVILEIERSVPSAAHWTDAAYHTMFGETAPPRIALLAQDRSQQTLGFLIARVTADECELENIAVASGAARQGIGSALLRKLLEIARERGMQRVLLEVRESNQAARSLYVHCGLQEDGRRKAYYSDPAEAAILYSLAL